jgi:excisionase family DNA binding protein
MKKGFLTAKEVAKLKKVHYDTVLGWIRDGLPAEKVADKGRKKIRKINLSKLERWLNK